MISDRTIERLSLYRRLLNRQVDPGTTNLFSHQLGTMACVTPAQVRRDLMAIGYSGSPARGYSVKDLAESISRVIDGEEAARIAVVGMGNLGRAIVSYLRGRRATLRVVATFDSDEKMIGRMISGCMCYAQNRIEDVIPDRGITVAVLAIPPEGAQEAADRVVAAGVTGILNYAPLPLRVPGWVYVENRDVTTALEKIAYFARTASEGTRR